MACAGREQLERWVNSDRIPWDCPAIVAGFSSYARKGITMSELRNRMIQDMQLAGLVEGTQRPVSPGCSPTDRLLHDLTRSPQ